jgi:Tol biopolymer transport system component
LLRFEQEARAAAALNHPNILSVYQMGTYLTIPYIVSELLEGKTLTEVMRPGPLPPRKAIDYAIQIARGLAAAHDKGILHRDLKPENLFITKEGRVKILDFGLAKIAQPDESRANLTQTITLPGVAIGTVGYMAPEQVRGLATDHRADIFSFGVILYEMLMGQRAFHGPTSADTMSAILSQEPPSISQLAPDTPFALERVVHRCLEKYPEQRFQSASDLAFALEAISDPAVSSITTAHQALSQSGYHGTKGGPASEKSNRRPLIAVIVLLALFALCWLAYFWMQPPSPPEISNYTQLTHDGAPKSLIGTDGSRLYLGLGVGTSGSFASHAVAEMSIAGGEPKIIPTLSTGDMIPIDLSPNGSEILEIDGQGAPPKGPLWAVPVLGGSPRRLGDIIAETATSSPDGTMLAYTNLGDLFVAKSDGTDARKLSTSTGDIKNVAWSPDGNLLRFDTTETAGTLGQQMIWEISATGANLHRVLPGWRNPPDECCGKWTVDGKYFVFQSSGQLWALPSQNGFLHSQPKPVQLTSSPLSLSSPLPSKDGKKLSLIGQTYRGELSRYDSKSAQFVPFLNGISAEYITFSKDGKWVAYVSYRDGALWKSRLDGSDRLQLTFPPMYAVLPRWSPDGKHIVFFEFAVSADKPARMYEVSSDGGSPRGLLPNDPHQQLDPNFSPDGSKIVFGEESNNPSSSIRILDLATNQVSGISGSQSLYSPRWSPDGKYLSAFSADSGTLLLFDFQTQKWSKLASGSLSWLNWSHDGHYVYVMDYRGKDAVVRIHVPDGKLEQVADVKTFTATGRYGGSLALTPDDSPLLLRDTGTQDVYSVDFKTH